MYYNIFMRYHNKLNNVAPMIAQAYSNGWTMKELAKTHGVSITTIRKLLNKLQVKIRPPGPRTKEDKLDAE